MYHKLSVPFADFTRAASHNPMDAGDSKLGQDNYEGKDTRAELDTATGWLCVPGNKVDGREAAHRARTQGPRATGDGRRVTRTGGKHARHGS